MHLAWKAYRAGQHGSTLQGQGCIGSSCALQSMGEESDKAVSKHLNIVIQIVHDCPADMIVSLPLAVAVIHVWQGQFGI